MKILPDYSLYLVLDPQACRGRNPLDVAREAVHGGVTLVQLRAPSWKKRAIYELALELKQFLSLHSVPLLINDDVDVAVAAKADGAHVGQNDLPAVKAREILGPDAVLGLSVSFPEHFDAALALPRGMIDYLGCGPAFQTSSKPDANPVIGVETIKNYAARSPYPVVAIGGINEERASEFHDTGISGICAISAICSSPSVTLSASRMKKAFSGNSPEY